jgi:hypothetical protein
MVVTTLLRRPVAGESEGALGDLVPFRYVVTARKTPPFRTSGAAKSGLLMPAPQRFIDHSLEAAPDSRDSIEAER